MKSWLLLFVVLSLLLASCRESVPVSTGAIAPTHTRVQTAMPVVEAPRLTFTGHSSGIDPDAAPIHWQVVFPEGTPVVYTTFRYSGMTSDTLISYRWFHNGNLVQEAADNTWRLPETGISFVRMGSPVDGWLSSGMYRVEITTSSGTQLDTFFVVLGSDDISQALEQAKTAEEAALVLQCAVSVAGLEWLVEQEEPEIWYVLGEAYLQGRYVTAEEIYRQAITYAQGGADVPPVDLEQALAYLHEDMDLVLAYPDHPDTHFYRLLAGGGAFNGWQPKDELNVLQAILFAHWSMCGNCVVKSDRKTSTWTSEPGSITTGAGTDQVHAPSLAVARTKAYIFVGELSGTGSAHLSKYRKAQSRLCAGFYTTTAETATSLLALRFYARSWTVTVYSGKDATPTKFVDCAKDPETAAIAFVGHSSSSELLFEDGVVDVRSFPDVVKLSGGLEEAILLGCDSGQGANVGSGQVLNFLSLMVKDPKKQGVASKDKLSLLDMLGIALKLGAGKPLSDIDTNPGRVTRMLIWTSEYANNLWEAVKLLPYGSAGAAGRRPALPDRDQLRNSGMYDKGRTMGFGELFPVCP